MQFCHPLSIRDMQADRYNWVNLKYHNYISHRIKQSYMRYFDGRKQRDFLFWWWCSRVLGRANAQKFSMTFICVHPFSMSRSYDQFVDLSHIPPFLRTCTHLEHPHLLLMWSHRFDTPSPVLILLVCHSFLILLYLRNSEISDSP